MPGCAHAAMTKALNSALCSRRRRGAGSATIIEVFTCPRKSFMDTRLLCCGSAIKMTLPDGYLGSSFLYGHQASTGSGAGSSGSRWYFDFGLRMTETKSPFMISHESRNDSRTNLSSAVRRSLRKSHRWAVREPDRALIVAQADPLRQPSLGPSRPRWHHGFGGQALPASAGLAHVGRPLCGARFLQSEDCSGSIAPLQRIQKRSLGLSKAPVTALRCRADLQGERVGSTCALFYDSHGLHLLPPPTKLTNDFSRSSFSASNARISAVGSFRISV